MPGVVILDFDGPLFSKRSMLLPQNNPPIAPQVCKELDLHPYMHYWYADPIAIAMLNRLYELYPYELVVSSSLADDWLHKKHHIEALLVRNGLVFDFHQQWRTPRHVHDTRHEQIGHWLDENSRIGRNYIIIDDVVSGPGLGKTELLQQCNIVPSNVFLVDEDEGISHKQFTTMAQQMLTWT